MVCCFIGHRKVESEEAIVPALKRVLWDLILNENVDTFLFGSRSQFNDLCLSVVTELKKIRPNITRVYVRAEFQHIDDDYEKYLLGRYDETYFSERAINAGRLVYILRNEEMIDKSDICVFYYNESYSPPAKQRNQLPPIKQNSGTKYAFDYATIKNKHIELIR